MRKTVIAFDIDGTLRCNCTETCRDTNDEIVQLARILKRFKNTRLIAWSGGGKNYTENFIASKDLLDIFPLQRCYSKSQGIVPDIAIDDIQDCQLGDKNLIVRMK